MIRRRYFNKINLVLVGIVLAFSAWELLAAFMHGVFAPMTTLSEYIWLGVDAWGAPFMFPAVAFCLWLAAHIAFRIMLRWLIGMVVGATVLGLAFELIG